MATETEIHREVALLVEREPRSVWIFSPTRETAQLNDLATVTPFATERDIAQLDDATTEKVLPLLREVAQVGEVLTASVRRTRTLSEVALLTSRVVSGVRVVDTLSEVAQLNDSAQFDIALTLRDTAELNDTASPTLTARNNQREVARLLSRAVVPVGATARDVAQLDDTSVPRIVARQTERDVAQLNDILTATFLQRALLREVAQLDDQTTVVASSRAALRDVAYVFDNPVPPPYGRAYTCSIATWGMSTLSNYKFETMAGIFAAGQNLWRLDAADDYGTPITSSITTGVLDMGAGQAKRLSAIYVAGTSTAPLDISVTADVNGQKEQYDYELDLRDQDDYRNNRALIGKGFRGRFIQFKIGGTAVKYRMLAAEADVSVTARRL